MNTPQKQESPAGRAAPICYASLVVAACVRYWEDATVNGEEDKAGVLIPHRCGGEWCPTINLETGKIQDWPEGISADIHYKVCDAGSYWLADSDGNIVATWNGYYVPDDLLAGGKGYGDYIILEVDTAGMIEGWVPAKIDPNEWRFSSHNAEPSRRRDWSVVGVKLWS